MRCTLIFLVVSQFQDFSSRDLRTSRLTCRAAHVANAFEEIGHGAKHGKRRDNRGGTPSTRGEPPPQTCTIRSTNYDFMRCYTQDIGAYPRNTTGVFRGAFLSGFYNQSHIPTYPNLTFHPLRLQPYPNLWRLKSLAWKWPRYRCSTRREDKSQRRIAGPSCSAETWESTNSLGVERYGDFFLGFSLICGDLW